MHKHEQWSYSIIFIIEIRQQTNYIENGVNRFFFFFLNSLVGGGEFELWIFLLEILESVNQFSIALPIRLLAIVFIS